MPWLKFALRSLILGAVVCASASAQSLNLATESDPDTQPARSFQMQVRTLFNQEDFSQLDDIAQATRSQKQRFLGGGWKLRAFYNALRGPGSLTSTDDVWNAHFARLERWIAASPNSSAPRVALAGAYLRFAWKARGNGPGETVTSEGWDLFSERARKARKMLDDAKSMSAANPQWYLEMETVALAQGWDRETTAKLVQEASNVEPDYFYIYNKHANYLLPKWYGQPGDSEDFLKSTADRIGGSEGDFIYFEVARDLNCCRAKEQMPNLSWERVKQGFAALEKLYGSTNQQLNAFAFMAVRQGDRETAQQLFTRIGDNWDEVVWGNKDKFERSKATLSLAPKNDVTAAAR
ncbi:MAG: DUF4034 domain-containing protein [Candidatus Acidiferrales bacterium]